MTLKQLFTDKIQEMQPYQVQSSGGMIKLDAMELPYKLPDEMRQALGTMLSMTNIHRYPNSQSTSLAAKIKTCFELPSDCEVLFGNGSDELIQIILMAVARPGATVLSPVPSFVMYEHTANLLGMPFVGVDLNADFTLNEDAFLAAVEQYQPAVIFLAYPNNPTGNTLDKLFIERVLARAPGLVVVDEAYGAYAQDSAADLLEKYNRLVVIRTLSKIGFAGIRLGYLAAQPSLEKQFEKVRMPYNINVLTQATARFMLDQMGYIDTCIDKVKKQKERQYNWFKAHPKIETFESQTNFLLIRVQEADKVFTTLRDDYKILVKNLHGVHPVLENVLRITVGRRKENSKLREALVRILGD